MIGETKRAETFSKTNAKRKLLKVEAEKVLKEQLSRGKVPPKAKFRADDEISIGEPAESRIASSGAASPRVGSSSPRVAGLPSPRAGASSSGLSSPRIGLSPRVQELKVRQANTPSTPTTTTTLPSSEDKPPQSAGDLSVEKQTPETERSAAAARINPETERAPRVNSLPLSPAHRNLLAKEVVAKSASLDNHYRPTSETPKAAKSLSARGSSSNFFQRISNLRQSFSERRSPSKITPHTTSTDTGFFQGISERKYTLTGNDSVKHGLVLAIPPIVKAPPPRRKRPRRVPPPLAGNKRSYSFTDAQFIAQAVTEGDNRFMDEFYPSFPVSDKIYSGIKARKVETEAKMVKPNFMAERTNLERSNPERSNLPPPQKTVISVGKENIKGEIDLRLEPRTPELSANKNLYPSTNRNLTPSSINFFSPQDPSPIISPWGRTSTTSLVRNSTSTSIQSTSGTSLQSSSGSSSSFEQRQRRVTSPVITRPDNVVLVECNGNNPETGGEEEEGEEVNLHRGIGPNHPFIRRVTSRSVTEASLGPSGHLVISTAEDGTVSSPDPFSNIISLADSNISQAESILSSLGCQRTSGLLPGASDRLSRRSGHEFSSPGLSSDIESNIRKLERTQAKINAALENIRTVQQNANNNNNNRVVNSSQRVIASTLDNAELFNSNLATAAGNRRDARHRVTYPQSGVELKSNPRKEDAGPPEPLGELKLRKTSLFRRHSFNQTHKDKPQAKPESFDSQRDSSVWSDADSARSSAIYDDCAFSDSEGSFSPLKNRIRGLLGSFGKGKKKLTKSPKKRPEVSMRDPMDSASEMSESLSIGQFTELVKNLPANSFNSKSGESMSASPSFLRPKNPRPHRVVAQNNSNDTYSSASTNQSFSNRNSVISAASISSESFDNDNNSASDEAGTSTSSPHQPSSNDDLTPAQRQERKLFFIAREIMSSERVYVDVLRLLNTEFREYVQKARQESKSGIMPDTDFVKLFSNLPELMMLNEDLLRDFEERVENWSKVKKIADVIVKKGPYLKLYTVFIRDFSAMNFHFEECCSRYPKFAKLVKEFEKLPRCQHLKLQHYMLKPVQRLPQYKLLLEDYLKHLEAEAEDFDDTTQALRIVSEAAEHANNTVKQGDKFQRMLRLQSRLGDWELIRPGRELIKEGELHKISRKGVGSRYFILLSDSLLYTSYQGAWAGDNTSLKVTYSIMLNQLSVNLSACQDREYSTEFSITSNVRSCTLRAKDVRERNEWLDALSTAIEDYRSRKATFQTGEGEGGGVAPAPGSLGESAPVWIPDQRVTMCQVCGSEFSLVVRRHHCRGCGAVVCTTCSRNKAPLKYKSWEPHRVCDACFDSLEKQHGNDEDLRPRFKKRDQSRHATKYIPQRLKLNANSEGSQMSGHLRRRGRGGKWKRHWFVLKDRVLYTYKASEDTVAVDTFPVLGWDLTEGAQGCDLPEGAGPELGFQLVHPNSENIVFVAETEESSAAWLKHIRESLTL